MSFQNGRRAWINNIVLFPASELSIKKDWQRIANALPSDSILICSSRTNIEQQRLCKQLSSLLAKAGHSVRLITKH